VIEKRGKRFVAIREENEQTRRNSADLKEVDEDSIV
jgi:hypothetical protein